MALEIFRLVGSIFVDTDEANKSISNADKKAQGLGQTLINGVGTAAKWGAAFAGAAAAGAAALYGVASKSASASDEIDKMSQKIGISRQAYQELDFVLSQNGMDVNQLQGNMKKLVNQMQSAQEGGKTATAAFDALGLSVTDGSGALKDQETMFYETISALQSMEDETMRNALAVDLFGGSATQMAPLLNAGAGSMEELTQKAHDLGLVLGDETINAGVAFTDTIDQATRSFEAVVTEIGAQVMPIINDLLQWVLSHMPEIQAVIQAVFGVIGAVVTAAGDAVRWLAGIFDANFAEIQSIVQSVVSAISVFWSGELQPVLQQIGVFIQTVLAPAFTQVFQHLILPVVQTVFNTIGQLWTGTLRPVFDGIINFITGVFTGNWRQAFQGLSSIVSGVFGGMITVVKTPINAIIGIVNSFIGGLNRLKVPDWIPVIGGQSVNISPIPYLAKGGEITGSGAAIVGEAGPELINLPAGASVTPLRNGGDVGDKLDRVAGLLSELLAAVKSRDTQIVLNTGALVGQLAPAMDAELGRLYTRSGRGIR